MKSVLTKKQKNKKDSGRLKRFVEVCARLDSASIYTLFEDLICDDLRDEIYWYARTTDGETCRESLETLGYKYNVQSLKDY